MSLWKALLLSGQIATTAIGLLIKVEIPHWKKYLLGLKSG